MEGEGVILGLGLDQEEATRRELGAELGCSDLKDRFFPGDVADTGVPDRELASPIPWTTSPTPCSHLKDHPVAPPTGPDHLPSLPTDRRLRPRPQGLS
jgi:hypothetical protein